MPRREYKNGYQEKIQYWTEQLNKAIANGEGSWPVERAMEKLQYFTQKHIELVFTGTIEDVETNA